MDGKGIIKMLWPYTISIIFFCTEFDSDKYKSIYFIMNLSEE